MTNRVLVVEDDQLNGILFCVILQAHGFVAERITDGRKVLRAVAEFEPDLIVMDIRLPHISGLRLTRMLRADERFRDIPVLAVTGYVGLYSRAQLMEAGAMDFLVKPVSISAFINSAQALLPSAGPPR